MVRSQQKKKTEAAAQKPAEETSDVTEDDKNLNENRGVEEMETKTESDTTKKKDFEGGSDRGSATETNTCTGEGRRVCFCKKKNRSLFLERKNSTYSTGRHTGGSGKKEEKQNIPLVELTDEQKAIFFVFYAGEGHGGSALQSVDSCFVPSEK